MKYLSLVIAILFFASCQTASDNTTTDLSQIDASNTNEKIIEFSAEAIKGKELYLICNACHNPELDSMLAPPMKNIQRRYKRSFPDKEEFIINISRHVKSPSLENALMRNALNKFELMPALPFADKDLHAVGSYIYEEKFEFTCREDEEEMHSRNLN